LSNLSFFRPLRLERDHLKQAQIECGYAQHWVMPT